MDDRDRVAEHIGAREAQKADACVEQPVLPPVVVDEGGPVDCPVVLDAEEGLFLVQVRTTGKPAVTIVYRHLDLGLRQR